MNPRLFPIALFQLTLFWLLPLAGIAQVNPDASAGTCTHKISLYQLSSAGEVSQVRLTSQGDTKIVLAKAPTGFATSSMYPIWVVWIASTQSLFPQGNPISDEFQLLFEPQYNSVHQLEISWSSPQGLICNKTLEIPCNGKKFLPKPNKQLGKDLPKLVSCHDGMLEFKDSSALFQFYSLLSSEYPKVKRESLTATESIARNLEKQFAGFRSLCRTPVSDTSWNIHPMLTTLLNHRQALKINGVIFAFNGPYDLYTIPESANQVATLQKLIQQHYARPLPVEVRWYNLRAARNAQAPQSSLAPERKKADACEDLFALPNE